MSANPFSAPASASGIQWADLKGRLLVIEPLGFEQGINTTFGATDAVRANVYVIDGEAEEYADTLLFPKGLVAQTKSKVGERVLGRLGQGQAKPGQSAPWLIQPPTEQDVAAGTAWLEQRSKNTFAAPAPAAQAGTGKPPF